MPFLLGEFRTRNIYLTFFLLLLFFFTSLISLFASELGEKATQVDYSLPLKVLEDEISLALLDFEGIKETIYSYNLIPNRKLAMSLVFLGFELMEARDPQKALDAFETAEFLDKTYFPAYLGKAEVLIELNVLNLFYSVPYSLLKGLFYGFKDFWQLSFFLGESILLLLAVLILTFGIFIFVVFLKYEVFLRHEIQELINLKVGPLIPLILVWIVIIICIFIGGIFWLLLLLGIFLYSYFSNKEKIVFILLLSLFSLSSLMLMGTSKYLSGLESDLLRVAVDYKNGTIQRGDMDELKIYLDENPEDFMGKFLLASMKSKFGIYNRDENLLYSALKDFEDLKNIKPTLSKLYNNTGNIFFSLRNFKQSINDYREAIALDAGNFAALYNMNLALRKELEFDEANVVLNKAMSINQQMVEYSNSLKIPNQNEGIRLIPQNYSFQEMWMKVKETQKNEVWNFMEELWVDLIKGVKLEYVPIFFFIMIILTLVFNIFRKKLPLSKSCKNCGVTYCRVCLTGREKKELCLQCSQLESKGSSISPELRLAKIAQIKKYESIEQTKVKVLSYLVPGCGHLYAGRIYQGILFLLFWVLISSLIITGMDILSNPWNIQMSGILWIFYLPFAAIAISFYFFVNFFSLSEVSIKER